MRFNPFSLLQIYGLVVFATMFNIVDLHGSLWPLSLWHFDLEIQIIAESLLPSANLLQFNFLNLHYFNLLLNRSLLPLQTWHFQLKNVSFWSLSFSNEFHHCLFAHSQPFSSCLINQIVANFGLFCTKANWRCSLSYHCLNTFKNKQELKELFVVEHFVKLASYSGTPLSSGSS